MSKRFTYACMLCLATGLCCVVPNLRAQIEASNQRVRNVESVRIQLANQYQAEGIAAVQHATTPAEAQVLLGDVRRRWATLWGICDSMTTGSMPHCHNGAWPTLVEAQTAWATAMEQAQQSLPDPRVLQQSSDTLRQAYCGVEASIPSGITPPPAVHTGCAARP